MADALPRVLPGDRSWLTATAGRAMTGGGRPLDAGRFSTWLADMEAALRGERDADVPCDGCTACCTSSQFVHIGPDETDTLAHIPAGAALPGARGCRAATWCSATTSAATARCSSRAAARSTSTGRGRAAPTTAGCSRPPASTPPTTARPRSPSGSGAGGSWRRPTGTAASEAAVRRAAAPPWRASRRRTGPAGPDHDAARGRRRRDPPPLPGRLIRCLARGVSEHSLI